MTHTNSSSFAFLHGHFWDFYEYNKSRMGDNNYLPIFYWIFALWNLPLKLLGLIPEVTSVTWLHPTVIQTIWSKFLLAVFFFASVSLVGKIADQISAATKAAQPDFLGPSLLFATSPIAIFSVFIFSGYDIFGLFFALLGLQSYFAKRWKWFAFWFSVAISFKYFAAFIYLPLVLIIEKRILYLIIFGVAGLVISALQFALYWHSDVFLGQIFGLVGAKTAGATIKIRPILANAAYVLMCLYLYFAKFDFKSDFLQWSQRAIYVCMLSYALLFSWVLWHPQWIILITPFVCLSFLFIYSQRLLLIIEILGYLGFAAYTMNNWAGNVDNTMLYGGAFGALIPYTSTLVTDVISRKSMAISRTFFYFSLYAPFLIFLFETLVVRSASIRNRFSIELNQSSDNQAKQKGWLFRLRFLAACYFVIAVSAACFVFN
ncbi:hypothetical protein C2745_01615 [Polynucleobacter sp. AP-Kolm-20A-A1]|nr:hypothetical protein C2745_01615 [Polynucleobacter sp. AP-Kolm-20A-A1]